MKLHLPTCLLVFFALIFQPVRAQLAAYDFSKPQQVLVLPDTLREISGITLLDSGHVACVQDENGIVFTVDLRSGLVTDQLHFAADGDYEGIAKVDKDLFVLRSDGVLFAVNADGKISERHTGISARDNEGLCYDEVNKRLLVASKSKPGKGAAFKDIREIYALPLTFIPGAIHLAYQFNVPVIRQFVLDHGASLPQRTNKKGNNEPMLRFTPSAIAVHPISHYLYLVSSADHLIFVMDAAGKPLDVAPLDPGLLPKPEGLIFLDNGDLLISSEAKGQAPTLSRFSYRP